MKAHKGYTPRSFPGHPGDCLHLENEDEPCWGGVTYSGHQKALACEGHQKEGYKEAPPWLTDPAAWAVVLEQRFQEIRDAEARKDQEEAIREVDWQNRGDTIAKEGKGPHSCWANLSDVMLLAITSMFEACYPDSYHKVTVTQDLYRVRADLLWECEQRQLTYPKGYYDLELAPKWTGTIDSRNPAYHSPLSEEQLTIDLSTLSDRDLQLLYGCSAEVVDYSCLERGARQLCMSLWSATEKAVVSRGLELLFLFDLDE